MHIMYHGANVEARGQLSVYYVVPGTKTEVVSLGGKSFYALSHPTALVKSIFHFHLIAKEAPRNATTTTTTKRNAKMYLGSWRPGFWCRTAHSSFSDLLEHGE